MTFRLKPMVTQETQQFGPDVAHSPSKKAVDEAQEKRVHPTSSRSSRVEWVQNWIHQLIAGFRIRYVSKA